MFQKKQKLFFIFLLVFILFSFLAPLALAKLEIQYPKAQGEDLTTFPGYVKYLFNFSIIIAGVVALGVMIFSGFNILTSPDQPSVVSDARGKIIGALIGIVILLSSYLILTTINPGLAVFSLQSLRPTTGVYLIGIDKDGKQQKHYVIQDTQKIDFEVDKIEFLSPPTELSSVFIYSGENRQGEQEIKNTGGEVGISQIKSIYFLWVKPGIYLYPQTDLKGSPLYTISSISNLSNYDFDNETQSIKFINDPKGNNTYSVYDTVLFSDTDFKGSCGITWFQNENGETNSINDMSNPGGFYREVKKPINNKNLSSLVIYYINPKDITGEVTFYDDIDCKGNRKTFSAEQINGMLYEPDLSANSVIDGRFFRTPNGDKAHVDPQDPNSPEEILYEKILSFEINGNFGVVLNTKENLSGKCQFFTKPSGTNCIPTLIGTTVYNEGSPGAGLLYDIEKVRSLIIVSLSK